MQNKLLLDGKYASAVVAMNELKEGKLTMKMGNKVKKTSNSDMFWCLSKTIQLQPGAKR